VGRLRAERSGLETHRRAKPEGESNRMWMWVGALIH
jgi:hypothetical protein